MRAGEYPTVVRALRLQLESSCRARCMECVTLDDVSRMIRTLRDLHDGLGQFLTGCGHQPSSGSQAAAEFRTFQRSESLETAYSQAGVLIEVAADQLMAFIRSVTEPVQTIAPWTCVRAIIESSAPAAWLLDPSLDARTRVQRSFGFRYEGLAQQVKFARASGDEPATAKAITRIDDVERVAVELGFSRVENQRGRRVGIAQQMPSITDLVAQALDEEATYRLLSAVAHAHLWAVQQLSFRRIEDENAWLIPEDAGVGSAHLLEKSLRPESAALLCSRAASAFVKPIRHKCQLFGWDMEQLNDMLGSALSSLGIRGQTTDFGHHESQQRG